MLGLLGAASGYVVPHCALTGRGGGGAISMNFFSDFLRELDNFADDATNRRLGTGAKFYGKRKSSFYGKDDKQRKKDPAKFDAEEDWRGPGGGSYFKLSKERDEKGRPIGFLTRKEARELEKREEEEKWAAARQSQQMLSGFGDALKKLTDSQEGA